MPTGDGVPDLRVLVAGDDAESLRTRLGDAGVVCEWVAPDALSEAVLATEGDDPPPLLVPLRGADLEPLREIRTALPEHPVIVVSLEGQPPDTSALREFDCDGGVSLEGDIVASILRASERRRLLSRIRRLEGRLEVEEHRFHNTVQRVADGIMILSRDGRVRFANAAAEQIFGKEDGGLVGQEFGFPVAAGETTEIDVVRGDREPGIAELRVTRTEWDDEPCLLVSVRDVTDRRNAERRERELIREQVARREAEIAAERNEFLAEASRRLYSTLERDEILERLTGLLDGRVGEACLVEALSVDPPVQGHRSVGGSGELAARLREEGVELLPAAEIQRLVESGRSRVLDSVPALGGRWALLVPLSTQEGVTGVLAVVGSEPPDPADQGLARELARRAGLALENARLFRLSRQASRTKSDFLNVVSHELRTPLTGIMGYVGLLEEGLAGPIDSNQRRYLGGIDRNSRQLLRIIDQILLYLDTEEERTAVRRRTEPLGALLDDVVSLARPMAEREGLELKVRRPPGDPEVHLDATKVRQIMLHLLSNAVKFTREGWIELEVVLEDDQLVLRVSDSGIGIPESKQHVIFEAFTQVESSETRVAGGTGIGLNVVRNLARLLGGSVSVSSAPDQGSTFEVRIPLAEDDA